MSGQNQDMVRLIDTGIGRCCRMEFFNRVEMRYVKNSISSVYKQIKFLQQQAEMIFPGSFWQKRLNSILAMPVSGGIQHQGNGKTIGFTGK